MKNQTAQQQQNNVTFLVDNLSFSRHFIDDKPKKEGCFYAELIKLIKDR